MFTINKIKIESVNSIARERVNTIIVSKNWFDLP